MVHLPLTFDQKQNWSTNIPKLPIATYSLFICNKLMQVNTEIYDH